MRRLRIFVSSPADVAEERFVARGVADRLQGEFAGRVILETFFWEQEPLLASADFQTQIRSPADYDIFVLILWARIGSRLPPQFVRADGSRFDSGTEYEFETALAAAQTQGKPEILVYRKTAVPTVTLDDETALLEQLEQKRALERFIEHGFSNPDRTAKAAYHTFERPDEFEQTFEVHLRKLIEQWLNSHGEPAEASAAVWRGRSPFRGLNTFEFEHAPVFFGRTRAVTEALDRLRQQADAGLAFLLVLGMSGGGKSSLVRAGVLPMLTRPGVIEGVTGWRRAIFTPAESPGDPVVALARALTQPDALPSLASLQSESELANTLRSHPEAVVPLIRQALGDPNARLVLVVDQLEELFTHRQVDEQTRGDFVNALATLAAAGPVWLIATLRSDFYPRCEELPALMRLKEGRGQYDLAPPTPVEIAQMIRFPARAAGLRYEEDPATGERLDDVLRDQASRNPETLPLLEFTLEELYQRRRADGVLTFAAYEEIGGVEGSIAQRAEHVFTGLPRDVQDELGHTLDRFIAHDPSDRDAATRLRANIDGLNAGSRGLVEAFVNARLFVAELDEQERTVGRIAHEALIKHWPRIQHWLNDNEENLRLHARLSDAAARWNDERSVDLLLPSGKPLEEAQLLRSRGVELSPTEHRFLVASERRVRRDRLLRRGAVVALALLSLGTAVGAGVALHQSQRARTQADTAQATSRFLVDLFQVSDPWTSSVTGTGSDITAREIVDRGAARLATELEDKPLVRANFLNAIGNVYQGLGLMDEAEDLLLQALDSRRRLLDPNDPDVADTLQSLSYVASTRGDYPKAERYLREAIEIRENAFGPDTLPLAEAMNLLSIMVANQDRLEEAVAIQQETLRIMAQQDDVDATSLAFAYNSMGYVLISADRYAEAIEPLQTAVALTEESKALGPYSRALSNLASAHQVLGHLDEARELHERALAVKRRWFEPGHSEIGYSLNNLAWVVRAQGDYDYAIRLYEEAIDNFTNALGAGHANVAVVRGNLATTYLEAGRNDEAIATFQEALEGIERSDGADSSNTLPMLIGLGRAYASMGNGALAADYLQRAVDTGTAVNPDSWHAALALSYLAALPEAALTREERDAAFERSLQIITRIGGRSHPDRVGVLVRYARHLDDTGRPDAAASLFDEALGIERTQQGGDRAHDQALLIEYRSRFEREPPE